MGQQICVHLSIYLIKFIVFFDNYFYTCIIILLTTELYLKCHYLNIYETHCKCINKFRTLKCMAGDITVFKPVHAKK